MNEDLPIIQLKPGPTDAELEAERDRKHALDVAAFDREERYLEEEEEFDIFRGRGHIPPWQVHG